MKKKVAVFLIVLTAAVSLWANQQHSEHGHTGHTGHSVSSASESSTPLSAGGEAAFTALIEVVGLLEVDVDTDWSNVDITALHSHLVDMSNVMLSTSVVADELTDSSLLFKVVATENAVGSLQRTARAHANYISTIRPWKIEVSPNETGVTVQITPESSADLQKLNALGFYGFMALDSHHQAHHWQIATGNGEHVHGSH